MIGNAAYGSLPELPGCIASAHAVGAALSRAGFAVSERHDLSNGEMTAAIAEFDANLSGPPAGGGVIYVCGYVTGYAGRSFLLPVSASLERDTDALTQGLLAASLPRGIARAGAIAGLVMLDLVAAPSAPPLSLDSLASGGAAPAVGVAATLETTADSPTLFAQAAVANIGPPLEVGGVLAGIRRSLAQVAGLRLWTHLPPAPSVLADAVVQPSRSIAASTIPEIPDQGRMSEADRRRAQTALVTLGYYAGPVDGLFGADTQAAIRRFQHEIGVEMTGWLTAAQAQQLLTRSR